MNPAIFLAFPAFIALALIINQALAKVIERKYARMLSRRYYQGVNDTKNEQRREIDRLRARIWSLEAQVRRFSRSANGVRP